MQHSNNVCTYHVMCCIALEQQLQIVFLSCLTTTKFCSCTVRKVKVSKPFKSLKVYIFNPETATEHRVLVLVSLYESVLQCEHHHKNKKESKDIAHHKPYFIVWYNKQLHSFINGVDENSMDSYNMAMLNMEPRKLTITIYMQQIQFQLLFNQLQVY